MLKHKLSKYDVTSDMYTVDQGKLRLNIHVHWLNGREESIDRAISATKTDRKNKDAVIGAHGHDGGTFLCACVLPCDSCTSVFFLSSSYIGTCVYTASVSL